MMVSFPFIFAFVFLLQPNQSASSWLVFPNDLVEFFLQGAEESQYIRTANLLDAFIQPSEFTNNY